MVSLDIVSILIQNPEKSFSVFFDNENCVHFMSAKSLIYFTFKCIWLVILALLWTRYPCAESLIVRYVRIYSNRKNNIGHLFPPKCLCIIHSFIISKFQWLQCATKIIGSFWRFHLRIYWLDILRSYHLN